MTELIPREIVKELDKYIIGQGEAKRSVAIAIRNRWRRQQLSAELRDEVAPKNIIMIGPTGVGKTEIARRLAHLTNAPFLKVEASKYTEVGYHGRDVESMVRDLAEISINMVKQEYTKAVEKKAQKAVEDRLLDLLLPHETNWAMEEEDPEIVERRKKARERMRKKLKAGDLEERTVEIATDERSAPMVEIFSNAGIDQMGMDVQGLQSMFEKIVPNRPQARKLTIAQARVALTAQEAEKLIEKEKMNREALERAENMGIIFIDEIDKVAVESGQQRGPDISRQGVQRDLLPIVEGSSVVTRYGIVRTDHILFIAAGAFHVAKPSDLIPELQGRFPIRVELKSLTQEDFIKILTEPKNALTKQYEALLKTEGLKVSFAKSAVSEIARICEEVNQRMQNIGARRLHTIMEKLLEDLSFDAPELKTKKVIVNKDMVRKRLADIVKDEDLSKYIL